MLQQIEKLANQPIVYRTQRLISKEYGKDKWGGLLKLSEGHDGSLTSLISQTYAQPVELMERKRLFTIDVFSFMMSLRHLVQYTINSYPEFKFEHVCELGAGYGFNLVPYGSAGYGGEYTLNGVLLGRKYGIDLNKFDFYDCFDYAIIKPKSVVFTCHAIEQLPTAIDFISNLRRVKDRISFVVNIEPCLLPYSVVDEEQYELNYYRSMYTIKNDYNRDLYSLLHSNEDIEIVKEDLQVLGTILNPANVFVWRFRNV